MTERRCGEAVMPVKMVLEKMFVMAAAGVLVLPVAARSEIGGEKYQECVMAADYAGCVDPELYGRVDPDRRAEVCDRWGWCLADGGVDRFGFAKLEGWAYSVLANGDVAYEEVVDQGLLNADGSFKRKWYLIRRQGVADASRYVGLRRVRHRCFLGGAAAQASPQKAAECSSADGAVSEEWVGVIDCVQHTRADYIIGKGLKIRWRSAGWVPGFVPSQCQERQALPVMTMNL